MTVSRSIICFRGWHFPTLHPREETHTCENITFPKIRWRVVIKIGQVYGQHTHPATDVVQRKTMEHT